VWPAVRGKVRLDGAALDQWSSVALGPHVGFLPQEVELFAGTIADNIARFNPAAASSAVIAAARAAGVHDLVLRLPEGYDTKIGEGGAGLSAGQRQRIGLARALYGDPFLVILDEPNANLDAEGENALTQAIVGVRQRGGICIVVAHRPSALAAVDLILMMTGGRAQAFGPKDEVLKRVLQTVPASQPGQVQSVSTETLAPTIQGAA
jgi:ATP-binding cassette subfamily C protein